MGISLTNHITSTDISYSGFYRLRLMIARMLSNDIGKSYEDMIPAMRGSQEEQHDWETEMNKAIDDYLKFHKRTMNKVLDFLFLPDTSSHISYGTCKLLVSLIGTSDKREEFLNTTFGYAGWGEHACKGSLIFKMLKECGENRKSLKWY